jgi:HEPN domain-containing protein
MLKAYFSQNHSEPAPYTHSLSYIAKKAGLYESFTDSFKNFIDQLEPLNIQTRYPSHKEKLMQSLTKTKCEEILKNTKELQTWIKAKLLAS